MSTGPRCVAAVPPISPPPLLCPLVFAVDLYGLDRSCAVNRTGNGSENDSFFPVCAPVSANNRHLSVPCRSNSSGSAGRMTVSDRGILVASPTTVPCPSGLETLPAGSYHFLPDGLFARICASSPHPVHPPTLNIHLSYDSPCRSFSCSDWLGREMENYEAKRFVFFCTLLLLYVN